MSALATLLDTASTSGQAAIGHPLLDYFPPANTIILLAIALVGFVWNWRKNGREEREWERKNDERIDLKVNKVAADIDKRVDALERDNKQFMPQREIEKEIDHARTSASTATSLVRETVTGNTRDITALQVAIGKIEQAHKGLEGDVSEIKSELREVRAEIKGGFKDVNDCLLSIAKKVS